MQPAGYSTYWQYTTALAFSVLAATNPVISRAAANAIESFILDSSVREFKFNPIGAISVLTQVNLSPHSRK
jgi:hypothetical protein